MTKQTHTLLKTALIFLMLFMGVGNVMAAINVASVEKPQKNPTSDKKLTFPEIHQFVLEMLNLSIIPNGKRKKFVRWEGPVRYYLKGLENYPEQEKIYVEKMDEVAKITGLDIKRHKQTHLKYQKKEQSKNGVWPKDDVYTNAVIYFFDDVGVFQSDSFMALIHKSFNTSPKIEYENWLALKKGDEVGFINYFYNYNDSGSKFYVETRDLRSMLESDKENIDFTMKKHMLIDVAHVFYKIYSNSMAHSLFYPESENDGVYTLIDQHFLRSIYKSNVHSGIPKRVAAFEMARYIAKKLNVKVEE